MSNRKSLFLGLIIGGFSGAAIALLASPKYSQDLKETLSTNSKKVKETLDTLKTESIQLKNQVVETSKEGAVILKDFSKDLKTSIDTWKKEIEPNTNKIIDELKSIEESIQQLEKSTKS